ncbi:MAG: nucleotidyltransferase [Caldilineaceae bacterium]|nr:nucleotidyltransferase [Caldilineaceae bacterium]
MPRTIHEGFQVFLSRLTPSDYETEAAKQHRASIKKCIESNFGLNRFWRTGSFGNGTSISGHSDVDYMASIPANSLKNNSSDSLSELRAALATRFPKTAVRTSCPAVVVPFGTDAKETTEVTPAFPSEASGKFKVYGIPDCSGGWMNASPDAHNDYVRSVDRSVSHKAKPFVRFIKAWKYFQSVPISSFYLELRVAKYASAESSIVYSVDIKDFFAHLDAIGLAQIRDPMGISGNISPCKTENDLESTKSKVSTALSRAIKAREAELNGDIKEAFKWWDRLFAYRFPSYYI